MISSKISAVYANLDCNTSMKVSTYSALLAEFGTAHIPIIFSLTQAFTMTACESNYLRETDTDDFSDALGTDGELPAAIEEAMKAFNKIIRVQGPVSWSPGKYAVALRWVSDAVWWSFATRLVFTGKADAVLWPNGQ